MSESLVEQPAVPAPVVARPAALAKLESAARDMLAMAQQFDVCDQLTLDIASAEYNSAKVSRESGDELRLATKRIIIEAGKRHDAQYTPSLAMLDDAALLWNRKITRYLKDEEAKRKEAQARARAAEAAERERLAKEAAERERKAREDAERLRVSALHEESVGNKGSAAQLRQEAERAERTGVQESQMLLSGVSSVSVAVDTPEPVLHGVSKPKERRFVEVTDLRALVVAIAAGNQPLTYVDPAQKALDKSAANFGDEFRVPGCVVHVDHSVARSRK